MQLRIEPLSSRINSFNPVLGQRVAKAAKDQQHPMRQPVIGVSLRIKTRGLNSPLQVIQNRNHVPNDFSFPTPRGGQNLSTHPLTKVLEVSLRPFREIQILVPLPLGIGQQVIQVLFNRVILCPRRFSRGWRGRGDRP
jgi:hypothetical protein